MLTRRVRKPVREPVREPAAPGYEAGVVQSRSKCAYIIHIRCKFRPLEHGMRQLISERPGPFGTGTTGTGANTGANISATHSAVAARFQEPVELVLDSKHKASTCSLR
jgi:hypothetical protein